MDLLLLVRAGSLPRTNRHSYFRSLSSLWCCFLPGNKGFPSVYVERETALCWCRSAFQRMSLPCAKRNMRGFPLSWEQHPDSVGKLGPAALSVLIADLFWSADPSDAPPVPLAGHAESPGRDLPPVVY